MLDPEAGEFVKCFRLFFCWPFRFRDAGRVKARYTEVSIDQVIEIKLSALVLQLVLLNGCRDECCFKSWYILQSFLSHKFDTLFIVSIRLKYAFVVESSDVRVRAQVLDSFVKVVDAVVARYDLCAIIGSVAQVTRHRCYVDNRVVAMRLPGALQLELMSVPVQAKETIVCE